MQDLWDMIKRQNLHLFGVEEGAEMQTKGIVSLFSEIIAENFPNLEKDMNIQI
jgi:hypothetical protein